MNKSTHFQPQLGRLINNQYITKKHLGSGSFGVVYRGEELESKMKIAIKIEKTTEDD